MGLDDSCRPLSGWQQLAPSEGRSGQGSLRLLVFVVFRAAIICRIRGIPCPYPIWRSDSRRMVVLRWKRFLTRLFDEPWACMKQNYSWTNWMIYFDVPCPSAAPELARFFSLFVVNHVLSRPLSFLFCSTNVEPMIPPPASITFPRKVMAFDEIIQCRGRQCHNMFAPCSFAQSARVAPAGHNKSTSIEF